MKKILTILLVVVVLSIGGYFAIGFYYLEGFEQGTWINGLYCTGKTVNEINDELLNNFDYSEVFVMLYDQDEQTEVSFALTPAMLQADYTGALKQLLANQNSFRWGIDWIKHQLLEEEKLMPELSVDQEVLQNAFYSLPIVQQEMTKEHGLELQKTQQGYALNDTLLRVFDEERAARYLYEAVCAGEKYLDLTVLDCYYSIPETSEMKQMRELWAKIEQFQNSGIVYDMGDEMLPINGAVVADWLITNEKGIPIVNELGLLQITENAIPDFVHSLAQEYNTYQVPRPFQTTRNGVVMVEGGTYGTTIDEEKEIEYLRNAFANQLAEIHIPFYSHTAPIRGKNDIGDTYIEIDIAAQTMYYYEDAQLLLQTPIVTGNELRRMGTPTAVCSVYGKQKNRVLRGPGYASKVKFWMPVKGGIGIHDASWRDEYGGEIYKTQGSHGCINTPLEIMEQLYEKVELGTPVVIWNE